MPAAGVMPHRGIVAQFHTACCSSNALQRIQRNNKINSVKSDVLYNDFSSL
jgi:hypothetical protein